MPLGYRHAGLGLIETCHFALKYIFWEGLVRTLTEVLLVLLLFLAIAQWELSARRCTRDLGAAHLTRSDIWPKSVFFPLGTHFFPEVLASSSLSTLREETYVGTSVAAT